MKMLDTYIHMWAVVMINVELTQAHPNDTIIIPTSQNAGYCGASLSKQKLSDEIIF